MGVWIEMTCQFQNHTEKDVAPFVGVWIEMASYFCLGGKIMVAPFVGVWIEIPFLANLYSVTNSRSLRGSVD